MIWWRPMILFGKYIAPGHILRSGRGVKFYGVSIGNVGLGFIVQDDVK